MKHLERGESSPPSQLRNYNPDTDYQAIREILEEGKLLNPVWDKEERLRKRIEERPDSIIVATVGDKIVGSVFLIDDFYPYIFRLAVKSTHRRQEIGEQLLNEAIKRLKEHGHEEIGLYIDDDNKELKAWYQKRGFHLAGKRRRMWKKL